MKRRSFGNETLDVADRSCFVNFDTVACVRSCILTILAVITLILVILKIIKYHVYKHPQMHHYIILYISAVECVLCCASFLLGMVYPQIDFAAYTLRLLQFSVICHLHWSLAAYTLREDTMINHFINPILSLFGLYCITVGLMGMVDVTDSWTECMRPYWLMLSSADLVIVHFFIVIAVIITHRIDGISTFASFKSPQKRDLLTIVLVYEISALLTVSYDAVIRFVGEERKGCSGMFYHNQLLYSSVTFLVQIVKLLAPVWTIIWIFQPVEGDTCTSEMALANRCNMESSPEISNQSVRGFHLYHRMAFPNKTEIHSTGSQGMNQESVQFQEHVNIKGSVVLSTISEESVGVSILDSPSRIRELPMLKHLVYS